jgi:hypothetical protein
MPNAIATSRPELNVPLLEECLDFAYFTLLMNSGSVTYEDIEEFAPVALDKNTRWSQSSWSNESSQALFESARAVERQINECSTSFCQAGYALMASGFTKRVIEEVGPDDDLDDDHALGWTTRAARAVTVQTVLCNTDKLFAERLDEFAPPYQKCIQEELKKHPEYSTLGEAWYVGGAIVLGLTDEEATRLFNGDNSYTTLCVVAKEIAKDRGVKIMLPQERYDLHKVFSVEFFAV